MHDQMTIFTTKYSIDFYDRLGRYERIGGLEVARVGDDERMMSSSAAWLRARLLATGWK